MVPGGLAGTSAGGSTSASAGGSGGPGGAGGPGGSDASFVTGGAPSAPAGVPPDGSAGVPPGGDPNPVHASADAGPISDAPGLGVPAGSAFAGRTNFAASADDGGGSPSSDGASPPGDGSASDLLAVLGQPGLTGRIGRPETDGGSKDRRSAGVDGRPGRGKRRSAGGRLNAPVAGFSLGRGGGAGDGKEAPSGGPQKAPNAGFSIGRDPGGVVLQQSVVPTIAAKPPTVTSSVISIQPVQTSGGTNPATAGPPAGGQAPAAPVASTQAPTERSTVLIGDGGPFGPGMTGANQAFGAGGTDVEGSMTMPPMGMGGAGGLAGAGSGRGGVQRQRLSYLPEEARFWGTEPDLAPSLGAAAGDDDTFEAPDSDAVPGRIGGIGAGSEIEEHEDAATDWRIR
jgi:hypothetical protein